EVGNDGDKVSVDVPRFKELRKLIDKPVPDDRTARDEHPTPGMFTSKRKVALGVAGAGVAAIVSGVVLGVTAKSLQNDAYAKCPDPGQPCTAAHEAQDLLERGHSRALFANIAFGIGGAAIIGAGVLWLLGGPTAEAASVAVRPQVGSSYSGVDVTVRF